MWVNLVEHHNKPDQILHMWLTFKTGDLMGNILETKKLIDLVNRMKEILALIKMNKGSTLIDVDAEI